MTSKLFGRFLAVALAVISLLFAGCGHDSPLGPTPPDPPSAPSGKVTIKYERQVTECRNANNPPYDIFCKSDYFTGFAVRYVASVSWPAGYLLNRESASLVPQPDGTFTADVNVPSSGAPVWAGQLKIAVFEPWLCQPKAGCGTEAYTGKGISVNGVRLKDGNEYTSFSFIPPDKITP